MSDQADHSDESPSTPPAASPTLPQDRSDTASGAVAALRTSGPTGAFLTDAQAQEILRVLIGVAALSTHAHRLEEIVASYGTDMNAISVSLGAARDKVAARMGLPVSYDFEASARAREQLAAQISSGKSISDILAAAVRVAVAFV